MVESIVRIDQLVICEVLAERAPGRAGPQFDGVSVPRLNEFLHVFAFPLARSRGTGAAPCSPGTVQPEVCHT